MSEPAGTDAVRELVRAAVERDDVKLAVADDDPTGTQTVRGVPLITEWTVEEIEWAMSHAAPTFAILTNSRSMDAPAAAAIGATIGERLPAVAARLGCQLRIISRSDSTLRGHFPVEVDALVAGYRRTGAKIDAVLVCPAFPEAGRTTESDVHWVRTGETRIPVGESEFARDATFGYSSSNLVDWIQERAGAGVEVHSIGLDALRSEGGTASVADELVEQAGSYAYVVANAAVPGDLDLLAETVTLAEAKGLRLLYRTGPSFLAARAGVAAAEPLGDEELRSPGVNGLVVVGSHTELTTAQLRCAEASHDIGTVELHVEPLLASVEAGGAADLVGEVVEQVLLAFRRHETVALVTSRRHVAPDSARALESGKAVADAIVESVRLIAETDLELGWIVAKGGITSHDVAVRALDAKRATVLGQLFPGQISVWEFGGGCIRPGLRYVVFPGNVGDEHSLSLSLDRLRGGR